MIVRHKKRVVFCAMSGGVDSSVAAGLLKEAGFDVIGVFMKNWTPVVEQSSLRGTAGPSCYAGEDYESAAMAANALGIPIYSWNFEKEYKEKVFEYMLAEYAAGRTPNPDVMCNRKIKFGVFFDRAVQSGADFVATGHYARIRRELPITNYQLPKYALHAGVDKNKDQSYFLWTLTQEILAKTLFPIGEYAKPQVRQIAQKFGLPNAERKDSQGLCFVGKVDFPQFLAAYISPRPGAIVTTAGKKIGEHEGVQFYTIGQRHGLGIGGGRPHYVVAKDAEQNVLTVTQSLADPLLWRKELVAGGINWISGQPPKLPLRCMARIRYRQPPQWCIVYQFISSSVHPTETSKLTNWSTEQLRVVFDEPQKAVAPGQSIVFYLPRAGSGGDGEEMLGGGVIAADGR